ncbi:hypothetical protein Wcon_00357 [Wolbachia endosymbiont of Cylisticus convexus]|nr:hypothetical protein Wcon_00357 [Wolbachia endosymbiont of Cylisticus convexus]
MYKTTEKILESEILLYTTSNGDIRTDVLYHALEQLMSIYKTYFVSVQGSWLMCK